MTISISFGRELGLAWEGGRCQITYFLEPSRAKVREGVRSVKEATIVRQSDLFYANIRQQKPVKSDKMG